MIVSIGTDICSYTRIEAAWRRFGDRFVERVLSVGERYAFAELAIPNRAAYLCKRFAAKEALGKALGTGIGRGISWQHIEVRRRKGEAPQVILSGEAKARADAMGVARIHLSLSDEKDFALAFVIFEG
ncbi:holo-[acyl-carrier protein] synthase [Microbulbifer donghaiensis]|uniref:Holo-[acyl-carrier-protein] synthase n=1 Tax=Microbulbifer donghaiensis TaxID=494016 RepID=A0A1M4WLL8_9GAMM|nr:holo-ACP synthase [Microbulbifer donghaiensis]SHE82201.1 holo-[acyl-carrier protein] synthase [Microbulbifer donghaiensis]